MLNSRTCRAIEDNIRDFNATEMMEFRQFLCKEIDNSNDLIDCIKKANGEDVHLDTLVRDQYYDAFLKMHLS